MRNPSEQYSGHCIERVLDLANFIYEHPGDLDLKLKGFFIADRRYPYFSAVVPANMRPLSLSFDWLERSSRANPRRGLRAQVRERLRSEVSTASLCFPLQDLTSRSQTFMAEIDAIAERCGYAGYIEEFVTFPPKGQLPFPSGSSRTAPGCNVRDLIFDAALAINPAFDIYRIFDTVGVSI